MEIACEKCRTQYVLDDRLVPPGGASVQCTRCGHVFTAKAPPPNRTATQLFEPASPPSAPIKSTQMFATPIPGPATGKAPTQVFGSSAFPEQNGRHTTQSFAPPSEPSRAPTQLFEGPTPEAQARPRSGTSFFQPPSQEADSLPQLLEPEAPSSGQTKGGDKALLLLFVFLVAVVGTFALKVWNQHQADLKEQQRGRIEKAFLLLRRDDASSRARAIDELETLSKDASVQPEAQADLVVALALAKDDAHVARGALEEKGEVLEARISRLEKEKSPNDWQTRVNALLDQLSILKREREPFLAQEAASQERAAAAYRLLPPQKNSLVAEDKAILRARAVYEAVRGSGEAVALIERYRQTNANDGWTEVAKAEYALNARTAPETIAQARGGLDALISRDSTFLRAYVLLSRLSLLQKKWDLAASALDIIVLLNPSHTLAQKLLVWAQEGKQREALAP